MPRITIIGLGLIGGSLGMALRQAKGDYEIVGHDRNPEVGAKARRRGAIDRSEWNLPKAVQGAALVIIATPAGAVESVLRDIAPHLSTGAVVTDTASTKCDVLAWAEAILPSGVSFVGGHPMAGKETSGVEEAEANLFRGTTYCVLPSSSATDEAVSLVSGLVSSIGAKPLFVDPVEHDSYVAAISHLPFLAATALVKVAGSSPVWRDIAKVAAGGFRDTTRMASGNTVMYRDICVTNREAILRWLDSYIGEVTRLHGLLASRDDAGLEEYLRVSKAVRDEWQNTRGVVVEPEMSSSVTIDKGSQMRHMLLGGWLRDRDEKARR